MPLTVIPGCAYKAAFCKSQECAWLHSRVKYKRITKQ
jgi:hypothetical protein